MTTFEIKDAGDPRKYFIQIPNMIDDGDLTVYEFRLYVHLKRVAGDAGKCYQSTQTLAKACQMSTGEISKAKKQLEDKGLIAIESKPGEHGGRDYHEITINDIWADNMASYSQKQQVHSMNLQVSPHELASSRSEIKEEPIKEEPIKNNKNNNSNHISPVAVLSKSSGLSAFPANQLEWSEVVYSMIEEHGQERTTAVMKSNCDRWCSTKNKQGKYYKRTDLRWINWAQEELATKPATPKDPSEMSSDELLEKIRADVYRQQESGS